MDSKYAFQKTRFVCVAPLEKGDLLVTVDIHGEQLFGLDFEGHDDEYVVDEQLFHDGCLRCKPNLEVRVGYYLSWLGKSDLGYHYFANQRGPLR